MSRLDPTAKPTNSTETIANSEQDPTAGADLNLANSDTDSIAPQDTLTREALLGHEDGVVRLVYLKTLYTDELSQSLVESILLPLLRHETHLVRREALMTLLHYPEHRVYVRSHVEDMLDDEDPQVRLAALGLIAKLHPLEV